MAVSPSLQGAGLQELAGLAHRHVSVCRGGGVVYIYKSGAQRINDPSPPPAAWPGDLAVFRTAASDGRAERRTADQQYPLTVVKYGFSRFLIPPVIHQRREATSSPCLGAYCSRANMDYSQAAYFAGAQAPYHQFPINIPPLTPSHSNSAGSEDFNTTSPPVSPHQQLLVVSYVLVHDAALSSPLFLELSCFCPLQPTSLAPHVAGSHGLHISYSGCLRPLPQRTVP